MEKSRAGNQLQQKKSSGRDGTIEEYREMTKYYIDEINDKQDMVNLYTLAYKWANKL